LKFSRILGLIIGVVQLASLVALVLGMQSMLGVFASAFSNGEQGAEIQYTDPVVIPVTLNPVNSGYLDATMDVKISMVVDGTVVASDSATVVVPAGSTVPVNLELQIPLVDAEQYFQPGLNIQQDIDVRVSTLYDLISFSNHMIMEVGGQ
jgi:hypothetical protein